jgi:hypothetical protein
LSWNATSPVELPAVTQPEASGSAVAGLVSQLHRDHADAMALAGALAPAANVHEPAWPGGVDAENLALAQADRGSRACDTRIRIRTRALP